MIDGFLALSWIKKLACYERIYVAFSGGLDSTVLLHQLTQNAVFTDKVVAIHINHGLSPHANEWQRHCQQVCLQWHVPCQIISVMFDRSANIEEGARNARYQVFAEFVKTNQCILTAHHYDDQVETVLLHLFRGAGIKGLCGMSETLSFSQGELHRPMLDISREDLYSYAQSHQLVWINDESNEDVYFSRNFIRQQVLPLLQSKWPSVKKNIARTSELCGQAQSNLADLAEIDYPGLATRVTTRLSLDALTQLSDTRVTNVLRHWLQKNTVRLPNQDTLTRLINELIRAAHDANPVVSWDTVVVRRYDDWLYLLESDRGVLPLEQMQWTAFPNPLFLSNEGVLSARIANEGVRVSSSDSIEVRFRKNGEIFFWHGQTKSLKKLMQDWQIPPWRRSQVPLIYVNNQLAVVVGYAISDLFYGKACLNQVDLHYYEIVLS